MINDGLNNLSFFMDYKTIHFVLCCDLDRDVQEIIYYKNGQDIREKVRFYTLDDECLKMPYVIRGGGHYTLGEKYFTIRKNLDNYQLISTIDGCGIVEIDGHEYICTKDTAILVDCRVPHVYRTGSGGVWDYKHIHFTVNDNNRVIVDKAAGFVDFCKLPDLDNIFKEVLSINADSPYILSNYMSNILTELIVSRSKIRTPPSHGNRMERAAKYMKDHFNEKINVEDLAKKEFVSVFYFTRQFKEYYGTTPYDYLIRLRINKAQNMLLQDIPIKEIAQSCGFGSTNNFFRIFKKYCNTSPSHFRERYL